MKFIRFSDNWHRTYFTTLLRHRHIFNCLVVALSAVCVFLSFKLELRTDFSELLPDDLPSVKALKVAGERIGGTGNLFIGIDSPDFESNKKFVENLVEKLKPMIGTKIKFYEYRYEDVQRFIETYGLHYLSLEQLKKMRSDLVDEIERKKDSAIGLGLDDETETKKKKEPWLEQLDPRLKGFLSYREAYLSSENGEVLVVSLKVLGSSTGINGGRQLISDINSIVNELNPAQYHSKMKITLAGGVRNNIREFETIQHDIFDTVLLLVLLMAILLFLFFWSVKAICLLSANLVFAVIWTFGVTQLHIGYLNAQTAFLGSLVAGTGINYGVIFLSRYLELRRSGLKTKEAIEESIGKTSIATMIASSTTAVAFVSLFLAENKGLSQFGFIGCVGVIFCWIAAYSLLPLWLYQLENWFPMKVSPNPLSKYFANFGMNIGQYFTRRALVMVIALTAVSLGMIIGVYKVYKDPIEYNFDNLGNKIRRTKEVEHQEDRVYWAFQGESSPTLVMLNSLEEAKALCPAVDRIKASLPAHENVIRNCMTIWELLPQNKEPIQPRVSEMKEIRKLFGDKTLHLSEDGPRIKRMYEMMKYSEPALQELPPQLVRRFTEKDGSVGRFGFIYSDNTKPLEDGRNLLNYTKSIAKIDLPETKSTVGASGESFILADLLHGLQRDAPIILIAAFGGVFLIAIFLCGGLTHGSFMAFCLVVGTYWLLGVQGFLGLKYNFFNFIALPLTFGIGIDYPINVYIRCRQEKFKNYGHILATSGTAVLLCSLTTIVGYYTLLGAANQALVGFAKLALIGEFTCLITALVVVPVALRCFGKFRD